jgi:hypothetical protein
LRRSRPSRLARLAETIETLSQRDEEAAAEEKRVALARQAAAAELHQLCATFAAHVNGLLTRPEVSLDPAEFDGSKYADDGETMFQINVRGRIVLLCFERPEELVSTENFREPYILEGMSRCFNQELLEDARVEENPMFYCTAPGARGWRYFHPRTYQTGALDENYLVGLFEGLV